MEQDEKFDNQFNLALDLTKEERERVSNAPSSINENLHIKCLTIDQYLWHYINSSHHIPFVPHPKSLNLCG